MAEIIRVKENWYHLENWLLFNFSLYLWKWVICNLQYLSQWADHFPRSSHMWKFLYTGWKTRSPLGDFFTVENFFAQLCKIWSPFGLLYVQKVSLPPTFAVHVLQKRLKCLTFSFSTVTNFRVLTLSLQF